MTENSHSRKQEKDEGELGVMLSGYTCMQLVATATARVLKKSERIRVVS